MRDENNHLKGEQGKPKVKANVVKPEPHNDHSSEKERRTKRQRHKSSKKADIRIDREEIVMVKKEDLPLDARFKGYTEVVVQDILLKTDNKRFLKEK